MEMISIKMSSSSGGCQEQRHARGYVTVRRAYVTARRVLAFVCKCHGFLTSASRVEAWQA